VGEIRVFSRGFRFVSYILVLTLRAGNQLNFAIMASF